MYSTVFLSNTLLSVSIIIMDVIVDQLKKLNRMPIIIAWHTALIIGNVR
jgi:hypothetical protein